MLALKKIALIASHPRVFLVQFTAPLVKPPKIIARSQNAHDKRAFSVSNDPWCVLVWKLTNVFDHIDGKALIP